MATGSDLDDPHGTHVIDPNAGVDVGGAASPGGAEEHDYADEGPHEPHDDHGHGGHDEHGSAGHAEPDDRWVLLPLVIGLAVGLVLVILFGLASSASPFA
jgi:hypothetical protein